MKKLMLGLMALTFSASGMASTMGTTMAKGLCNWQRVFSLASKPWREHVDE